MWRSGCCCQQRKREETVSGPGPQDQFHKKKEQKQKEEQARLCDLEKKEGGRDKAQRREVDWLKKNWRDELFSGAWGVELWISKAQPIGYDKKEVRICAGDVVVCHSDPRRLLVRLEKKGIDCRLLLCQKKDGNITIYPTWRIIPVSFSG